MVTSQSIHILQKGRRMKLIRLSLLLMALTVSFAAAPDVFAAKAKGGSLGRSEAKWTQTCYEIHCYGFYSGLCCGTLEECMPICASTCNLTPPETCIYIP
jgi:hypothetical protein